MLKFKFLIGATLSLVLMQSNALADEPQNADATDKVRNSLKVLLPNLTPDSIAETPIKGLYEVMFGARLIYISEDGRYMVQGSMIDLERRENLTEPRLAAAKVQAVEDIGEENMLIYGPKSAKHTITVFTDIDCGYCRKLHSEIEQLNTAGVRVRYLLYPRTGENTESYFKAVSAWCADDPHKALTDAKQGKTIPKLDCENPVKKHMEIGKVFGLQGTPALVLADGEMIPGYVPWERLSKMLDQRQTATR